MDYLRTESVQNLCPDLFFGTLHQKNHQDISQDFEVVDVIYMMTLLLFPLCSGCHHDHITWCEPGVYVMTYISVETSVIDCHIATHTEGEKWMVNT